MNLDNIKLLRLNITDYFWDLTILVLVGLVSNQIVQLVYFNLFSNKNTDNFPLSLYLVKIFFWIIVFLCLRWLWYQKIRTVYSLNWPAKYGFDSQKDKLTDERYLREWIFQGNVQPFNGGLLVTNSNSGCLIKPTAILGLFPLKRIWKNFTANVEIDFPTQSLAVNPENANDPNTKQNHFDNSLGIIFRAQSLDDYFMIQIMKGVGCLVFRPHIRSGVNWEVPYYNIDSNTLPFISAPFSLNIMVKDDIVTITVGNNSIKWILPTYVEPNLIQKTKSGDETLGTKTLISEVYFRNRAGMFGFRNYGNELALVKSLDIH